MTDERVLVVDDEPDYRSLMKAHLARKGYEVVDAANGKEALALVEGGPTYHVLVVDLMMPEMDGLELLRRAKVHDPDLEVVVISGVGTLESAISSMRMGGAYDYLPKPLDSIRDLSLAVERAAAHRRLRVEREQLQAQVAAERERLQTVIENTRDALISADEGSEITVANPAASELFGEANLVGQGAGDCLPAPLASLLLNWRSYRSDSPMVTEVAWPAGQVHMVSLAPLGEEDGVPPGWVMLLRDVTEIRNLQRLKMQLLAQAAGGLREPLTAAFSTMVELNEFPEEADEAFTGAVQRGMDQLSAIRQWTDEVLALVEIEAGLRGGERADLAALIEERIPELQGALFKEKELALEWEADRAGPTVKREPAERLLHHLVEQAAWRSDRQGAVRIALRAQGGQSWLTVSDAGPALVPAPSRDGFEAFVAGRRDELEGVGLNLAMIKTAADALGGQLWVWSGEEGGTTLGVSFPDDGDSAERSD